LIGAGGRIFAPRLTVAVLGYRYVGVGVQALLLVTRGASSSPDIRISTITNKNPSTQPIKPNRIHETIFAFPRGCAARYPPAW
jgi:hypothetical protein